MVQTKQPGEAQIERLRTALRDADAVVIGAGAGLSTSAGFTYAGERFDAYFGDFEKAYGFADMYAGGFYPYDTLEQYWGFWSRDIYVNRYQNPPKPVYERLYELVKEKDYFVLTTNVDHCFQKAGFAKNRLFYTQGDYGLFQCEKPCHERTYDNETQVRDMLTAQGWRFAADGTLKMPEAGEEPVRKIPAELVPRCPVCGRPMTMNLRCDDTFVEDEGWHAAAERYEEFLRRHRGLKTVFLELGTGYNTPGIIKYPFWQMAGSWRDALYACINLGEAACPAELEGRAICIDGDIGEVLAQL